jgi:ABC-2 type transport system ATP-binding protein/lipopolysaccharide transport system ATP-binding protein
MNQRLVFDNVTVDIPIYDVKARSLKHRFFLDKVSNLMARTTPHVGGTVIQDQRGIVTVRALNGVSFTAADGDRIGIIGHNGAGKTTLLRVASRIFEPTQGSVSIHGRVTPLFNMMEGVAQDATGIEVIRTRGALLGMTDAEIEERMDDVTAFCDLGEYIDMPVRTYSTGMLVRLAFAITTSVTSDVLVMDEFIGAGDAAFFERAEARLRRFIERSAVLLVATHSFEIVRKWCNRAILFKHGQIVSAGAVEEVLNAYTTAA